MYFFDDVIFVFVELRLSRLSVIDSSRFWYVVAETILYKKYDIYFWFWWRHHSQILD